MKLQVKKTFECSLEEKQRCTIQTNNRGWSGMHSETLDPKNQKVNLMLRKNDIMVNAIY
jgi:hypothetical protein